MQLIYMIKLGYEVDLERKDPLNGSTTFYLKKNLYEASE